MLYDRNFYIIYLKFKFFFTYFASFCKSMCKMSILSHLNQYIIGVNFIFIYYFPYNHYYLNDILRGYLLQNDPIMFW